MTRTVVEHVRYNTPFYSCLFSDLYLAVALALAITMPRVQKEEFWRLLTNRAKSLAWQFIKLVITAVLICVPFLHIRKLPKDHQTQALTCGGFASCLLPSWNATRTSAQWKYHILNSHKDHHCDPNDKPMTMVPARTALHTAGAPEIWIDQSEFSRRQKLCCPDVNAC